MNRTSGQDNGRRRKSNGQTALVLILLTAAALIFYAISLNWGRIAQNKALLTVAANQAAAVLASDAASYGESNKVQWLGNQNSLTESTGAFIDIIMIVIAVVLTVVTGGMGSILAGMFLATVVLAAANLTLQLTVIQPGITSMWNSAMLKDQPNYEQFYEQGIQAALAGSITDQVNIADYFDSNGNGVLGIDPKDPTRPQDSVGRFAFFYSERLKMLNAKARIPQIQFFYDQLGQFMNGQTCADNLNDNNYASTLYPVNPVCKGLDCSSDSLSTAGCQTKIAGAFQLNDPCTDSDITAPLTYNPYCDPCCQPYFGAPDPLYNPGAPTPNDHPYPFKTISCPVPSGACVNDAMSDYNFCIGLSIKCTNPDSCSSPSCRSTCLSCAVTKLANDPNCMPVAPQCVTNNPYPPCPDGSSCPATGLCDDGKTQCGTYPYIYDPAFQNYPDQVSFLAQFGRDQQWIPPGSPSPLTTVTPDVMYSNICTGAADCTVGTCTGTCVNGVCTTGDGSPCPPLEFPNGIYPFFWMMKDYSPRVDNIVSTSLSSPAPLYWCAAVPPIPSIPPPAPYPPEGFPDLAQLSVPGCSQQSCCVNSLANSVTDAASVNPNIVIDTVGDSSNPALDTIFGEPSPPAAASGPWTEGDNQYCSAAWPYNGSSATIPDGTCELGYTPVSAPTTGSLSSLGTNPPPTVDQLDNVMHALSDFVNFANVFLNKDIGQLNSTFHSWYPSVAKWIAPKCDNSDWQHSPPVCNSGSDGRLLNIYNPYISISDPVTGKMGPLDLLSYWEELISKWLRQDYTGSVTISGVTYSPWCEPLPTDSSMNVTICPDGTTCPVTDLCDDGKTPCGPTAENAYIADPANNSDPSSCTDGSTCGSGGPGLCKNKAWCGTWGDLPHVMACLNYNADHSADDTPFGSVYNFQQCSNDLKAITCPVTTDTLNDCSAVTLGRSLAGPNPGWNGKCTDPGLPAFKKWVNDSLTLAISQAPKFAKRYTFLTDIYTKVRTMKNIFDQGDKAVNAFLKPCSSIISDYQPSQPCDDYSMCGINKNGQCADGTPCGCQDGGPAAQLMWARDQGDPAANLPNSVIYGWQDKKPIGGGGCSDSNGNRAGCIHIVKVTAYSAGRCGGPGNLCNKNNGGNSGGTNELDSLLPWIQTSSDFWSRTYTLTDRDEFVHVTIQRWDQDHANALSFPNGLPLWTFSFHNPLVPPASILLQSDCFGLPKLPGSSAGGGTGFGLKSETVNALLNYSALESGESVLPQDATALGQAFMLNGDVDLNDTPGSTYSNCLTDVNNLLLSGMTSEACAEYVATGPPSSDAATAGGIGGAPSQDDDANYKIIFEKCPY